MIPKWSHSKISWRSRSAIHTISRIEIFPRSYHEQTYAASHQVKSSQSHDFDFFVFFKKVKSWLNFWMTWLFLKKMTFGASLTTRSCTEIFSESQIYIGVFVFVNIFSKKDEILSFRRSQFEIQIRSFQEILHRSCYEIYSSSR